MPDRSAEGLEATLATLVEVTPASLRVRKRILKESDRRRSAKR